MDAGVSPMAYLSNFIGSGQHQARHLSQLPGAAVPDPNQYMPEIDLAQAGMVGIQRRPTEQWPGQPILHDAPELCPHCPNSCGLPWWNGLNVLIPPYPKDMYGVTVPIYGKTPLSYFRDNGPVPYYTLMLWRCPDCTKFWYHYLFHQITRDGRVPPRQSSSPPEAVIYQAPALTQTHSTPGRVPATRLDPLWSPGAATLVGQQSPGPSTSKPMPVPAHDGNSDSNASSMATRSARTTRWKSNEMRAAPTSAPPATDTSFFAPPSFGPSTPSQSFAVRSRPTLEVNTNTGKGTESWSTCAARTIEAHAPPPGLSPLTAASRAPSPSGLSPVAPTSAISMAPTPAGDAISPVRRRPTEPQAPPAKKVHRDAAKYNKMRRMLACDDCRRRKKACDPKHTGPRRKWAERAEAGSSSGAHDTVSPAAGSGNASPDFTQEEWEQLAAMGNDFELPEFDLGGEERAWDLDVGEQDLN